MNGLWNIKQVQEFLGVSRRTIYRWVEKGIIPRPIEKDWGSPRWNPEELLDMKQASGLREKALQRRSEVMISRRFVVTK